MTKEAELMIDALKELARLQQPISGPSGSREETEKATERLGTALEALIDARISAHLNELFFDDGK